VAVTAQGAVLREWICRINTRQLSSAINSEMQHRFNSPTARPNNSAAARFASSTTPESWMNAPSNVASIKRRICSTAEATVWILDLRLWRVVMPLGQPIWRPQLPARHLKLPLPDFHV
jgi:hypothetical protein